MLEPSVPRRKTRCYNLCITVRTERLKGKEAYASTMTSVRFEAFTALKMKHSVLWDVTPCGSCKNRRFGGTYFLHHQGDKNR
jgi:hypothetical protein